MGQGHRSCIGIRHGDRNSCFRFFKPINPMSVQGLNEDEFQHREQQLKEREMKVRLRELEAELDAQRKIVNETSEETEPNTVKKEVDREALAWQRKLRKMMLFGKLALLAIGVAATVIVLKVLIFPVIILGALGLFLYGIYVLFIQEKSNKEKPDTQP